MSATLSVQISVPSTTTTTCQNVRGAKDEGGGGWVGGWVPLLTQLHRLRGQQPTCWRRQSPGHGTPALAPVSSGPAGASLCWSMTPLVPALHPVSSSPPPPPSSFHLASPDYPSLSTPGRRSPCFSRLLLRLLCLSLPRLFLTLREFISRRTYACPPPPPIRSP